MKNILCYSVGLEHDPFRLKTAEIYPLIENSIANTVVDSTQKLSHIYRPSLQCTRGSLMSVWLGNDNYTSICICPSNYYGNQCEYQNQRVSLTLTLLTVNAYHIYAVFIKLIDDDNNRQEIQSFKQIIYISMTVCSQSLEMYFLY